MGRASGATTWRWWRRRSQNSISSRRPVVTRQTESRWTPTWPGSTASPTTRSIWTSSRRSSIRVVSSTCDRAYIDLWMFSVWCSDRLAVVHQAVEARQTRRALLAQLGMLAAGLELAAACDRLPGQAPRMPRIGWVANTEPLGAED